MHFEVSFSIDELEKETEKYPILEVSFSIDEREKETEKYPILEVFFLNVSLVKASF